MLGLVSNTDRRWFDFLAGRAGEQGGVLDEVNFWRPRNQRRIRVIDPGAPFFLRLKRPTYAIAGFGFFAHWHLVSIHEAWALFGEKNGAPDFETFRRHIAAFRGTDPAAADASPLGCIILRDVTFLPQEQWLRWGAAQDWSRNIVSDSSYDLARAPGTELLQLLHDRATPPPELADHFELLPCDERRWRQVRQPVREGQGTFRLRLLDAYGQRCAVTRERVVPVLEAAHIQPYLGAASNHVQNGLLLRSDLHHLYDEGYLTVTPDYTMRVSDRIREEYQNGRDYYALRDRPVKVPDDPARKPSRDALAWHEEFVFS